MDVVARVVEQGRGQIQGLLTVGSVPGAVRAVQARYPERAGPMRLKEEDA